MDSVLTAHGYCPPYAPRQNPWPFYETALCSPKIHKCEGECNQPILCDLRKRLIHLSVQRGESLHGWCRFGPVTCAMPIAVESPSSPVALQFGPPTEDEC